MYGAIGNPQKCLRYNHKAIAMNPNDPIAIVGIAEALTTQMEFSEAERYLQKGLKLYPNDPNMHHKMGMLNEAM